MSLQIARLDPSKEVEFAVIGAKPTVKFSNMETASKPLLLELVLLLLRLALRIA